MSVTVLELAIAANTVYNFYKGRGGSAHEVEISSALDREPPGYRTVLTHEDLPSGFFGAVYKPTRADREFIIACRGTVVGETKVGRSVGMKNAVTDVGLYAIESLPASMRAANLLVEQATMLLPNVRPILCGHSLGGAIATILAFQNGFPCCAFNAPTVTKMIRGGMIHGPFVRVKNDQIASIERQIVNFNLQWDPISKSSKAIGKVIKLPASLKEGGHSQDKVIANLKGSTYASKRFIELIM